MASKGSRRPCITPGCPHSSQTEDPECSECRDGKRPRRAPRARVEPITEPCAARCCDRPARALGYCDTHYRQFRTHGRIGRIQQYQRSNIGRAA